MSYLLQLAKGLRLGGADSPSDVYRDVSGDKWHVPFDQMIYVGDGASDLPAFDLMEDRGGIAIGVVGPQGSASGWSEEKAVHPGRRVQNVARVHRRGRVAAGAVLRRRKHRQADRAAKAGER